MSTTQRTKMNPIKVTYTDVVKNASAFLNPGIDPTPLTPKAPRVRLSKQAVQKLRSVIHDKPVCNSAESKEASINQPVIKTEKHHESGKPKNFVCDKTTQPLILATASDWVMSGSAMSASIYDVKKEKNPLPSVRLLNTNEIGSVEREGKRENPIDVCDDSDEAELNYDEHLVESRKYSVDGMAELDTASDFDADVVFANSIGIFDPSHNDSVIDKKPSDLNVSLRLNSTDQLRKAKR